MSHLLGKTIWNSELFLRNTKQTSCYGSWKKPEYPVKSWCQLWHKCYFSECFVTITAAKKALCCSHWIIIHALDVAQKIFFFLSVLQKSVKEAKKCWKTISAEIQNSDQTCVLKKCFVSSKSYKNEFKKWKKIKMPIEVLMCTVVPPAFRCSALVLISILLTTTTRRVGGHWSRGTAIHFSNAT